MMQKLAMLLRGQPQPQQPQGGLEQQAMQAVPAYKEYAITAQSNGQQPMSFNQFRAVLQQQMQQKPMLLQPTIPQTQPGIQPPPQQSQPAQQEPAPEPFRF